MCGLGAHLFLHCSSEALRLSFVILGPILSKAAGKSYCIFYERESHFFERGTNWLQNVGIFFVALPEKLAFFGLALCNTGSVWPGGKHHCFFNRNVYGCSTIYVRHLT